MSLTQRRLGLSLATLWRRRSNSNTRGLCAQMFPSEMHAHLTAASVLSALRVIYEQFSDLHSDPSNLSAAHDLLLLFYSIGAPSWRLAMAVSLNQQSQLQHFRQRMPKHWQEVRAAVMTDETLRHVWQAL